MSLARTRLPALFIGHRNPMNALQSNAFTLAWRRIAATLPRPRAIVSISAHWYQPGTRVTPERQPRTIHDFVGFPPELSRVRYPAPGSPEVAARLAELFAPARVARDESWGLDHGTWSILRHMFPDATVPGVQLGIDATASAAEHVALGQRLRPLREEGVLLLGSGNVVHNLHAYAWGGQPAVPYDWAVRFETRLRALLAARDVAALARYEDLGPDAALSAPTPEHFLPLLYIAGAADPGDPAEAFTFPVGGFDGESVSMLGVQVGM